MRIRIAIVVLLLVTLASALDTGFVLIWRLLFLALMAIAVGYIWTLLSSRGIDSLSKPLPVQCQVGDSFIEEFTLFNASRVPKLLLEAEESSDLPGHRSAAAFNLSPGGSHSWQAEVLCQRRGLYSLGPLTVTARDPFGLFSRRRNLGEPRSILVWPATSGLPFFELLARQDSRYGHGARVADQISSNVAGVREYTSGDSLKNIHWHSTAHTGKPHVKVFEPDRSRSAARSIWIVVDMHHGSHLGEGDQSTQEYCVTIAASLAKKYVDSGCSVGLMASGEQFHVVLPEDGERSLINIMKPLAVMKASGDIPIDHLISRERARFGINSAVIVITPNSGERVVDSLRQLKSRGRLVVTILLDSISFGGTTAITGNVRALMSSGMQVNVVRHGDDLAVALDSRAYSQVRDTLQSRARV